MTGDDHLAEAASLLERLEDRARRVDLDADLAATDDFLARADQAGVPAELIAQVFAAKARACEAADRPDDAITVLDELVARFGADPDLLVARATAYALLTKTVILINCDRLLEAVAVADQLLAAFNAAPEEQNLTGLGFMLLDVVFLLLAHGQEESALRICEALVARLRNMNESRQAVAAGALFYEIQALIRLGRAQDAHDDVVVLHEMGQPALSALDRIAAQFGPEETNPLWHSQIMLSRAWILLALGRVDEGRTIYGQALQQAERYDLPPELADGLRDIEKALAASS